LGGLPALRKKPGGESGRILKGGKDGDGGRKGRQRIRVAVGSARMGRIGVGVGGAWVRRDKAAGPAAPVCPKAPVPAEIACV